MKKSCSGILVVFFIFLQSISILKAQSCWSELHTGLSSNSNFGGVYAMTGYNSDLIAGGYFENAGGLAVSNIAAWNGSAWSALGSGINNIPYNAGYSVLALTMYNGDLIAGGSFDTAGGTPANGIARWNGSAWSPLGAGITGNTQNYSDGGTYSTPYVTSMAVYGNDLYAGGVFTHAGTTRAGDIARWDGSSWSALATGIDTDGVVASMTVYNGKLIVAGDFNNAGGVQVANIAAWDGTAWTTLGAGLGSTTVGYQYEAVQALAVYGGDLYASLSATDNLGHDYFFVAKWDGSNWTGVAGGPGTGTTYSGEVVAMLPFDGQLMVSGEYSVIGNDSSTTSIAQWNGTMWSGLDSFQHVLVPIAAMASYNGHLYAGGQFADIGGVYAINIAENSCLTTGIKDISTLHVSISPNPSTGIIHISIENGGRSSMEVYDLMGQRILRSELVSDHSSLDMRGQAPGTYLYRIAGADGGLATTGSFVIQ